jgi:putative colanic acid biosynthesis acetyltransferase WcaF
LRLFGADIGKSCIIKPRVNIHFPWKLVLGPNVWIGEEVFILNFERVEIHANCCISQRAFLCGGNHDYTDVAFKYRNGPIIIERGAWIGAGAFIGPNVVVREHAVVSAYSVVATELQAATVYAGNPCVAVRRRWKQEKK